MRDVEPESGSGGGPLRPDATIEDIQARVAQLSSEAGSSGATTDGAVATEASPAEAPRPTKPRRKWLGRVGGVGAIGVGVLLVAAKLGLKLLVVGVAGAALAGAFGGRYDQLPASVRDGYEQRYQAAIGSSLDGLSDTDRAAHLQELVTHGASRLDDAALVAWTRLDAKAISLTDSKTCAAIAHGWFSKGTDMASVGAAVSKSYESLSNDEYSTIVDLDLRAIEAEKAGSPAVRTISDSVMGPVFDAIDASLSSTDQSTISDMTSGTTVTDDVACTTLRHLNAAAATLPDGQYQSWAVWTSVP